MRGTPALRHLNDGRSQPAQLRLGRFDQGACGPHLTGQLREPFAAVCCGPKQRGETLFLRSRRVFDRSAAMRAVDAHQSGQRDYGYAIWTMAMVELWYRTFIDSFGRPTGSLWG